MVHKGVKKIKDEHQQTIEEKDAALFLTNDNPQAITDHDNRIQAIQYENVGIQGEIRAKVTSKRPGNSCLEKTLCRSRKRSR